MTLIFLALIGIEQRLTLNTKLTFGTGNGIVEQRGNIVRSLMNMLKPVFLCKIAVKHIRNFLIHSLINALTKIADIHIGIIYRLSTAVKNDGRRIAFVYEKLLPCPEYRIKTFLINITYTDGSSM